MSCEIGYFSILVKEQCQLIGPLEKSISLKKEDFYNIYIDIAGDALFKFESVLYLSKK